MRGSISTATRGSPPRTPARSSRPTPRRRWSRSSKRRCRAIRRRSTIPSTMLSYTKIVAPIDGRTGMRLVDEGNLVQANDATGIVVITQVQADLGAVQPAAAAVPAGQQGLRARARSPVDAMAADGKTVVDRGKLQVIDNQIDQTTGTIRMKAEFPNADLQLWPGQFVNVRAAGRYAEAGRGGADRAVQRGPNGTFVYVVEADSKVAVRPVTVAQQDDTRAVIADGVKAQRARGHHRLHAALRRHARARAGRRGRAPPAAGAPAADAAAGRSAGASADGPARQRRRRASAAALRRTRRRPRRAPSNERLGPLHPRGRSRPRCSASR